MQDLDPMLTLNEVAEHLGVPVRTVYAWRYAGTAPRGVRVGKHVRVRRSDLQEWIEQRIEPPAA